MAKWKRVSQIDIPVVHEFRPLTDEETKEFITSMKANSQKILQESDGKAALPLVEPMPLLCAAH